MCPECDGFNLVVKHYDCGVCHQTGYHDAGEYFECRDCGAKGDVSEIVLVGDSYA